MCARFTDNMSEVIYAVLAARLNGLPRLVSCTCVLHLQLPVLVKITVSGSVNARDFYGSMLRSCKPGIPCPWT